MERRKLTESLGMEAHIPNIDFGGCKRSHCLSGKIEMVPICSFDLGVCKDLPNLEKKKKTEEITSLSFALEIGKDPQPLGNL